jgi:hypothetical protein
MTYSGAVPNVSSSNTPVLHHSSTPYKEHVTVESSLPDPHKAGSSTVPEDHKFTIQRPLPLRIMGRTTEAAAPRSRMHARGENMPSIWPLLISKARCRFDSAIGPRITPKISGPGGNPNLFIMYPKIPNTSII